MSMVQGLMLVVAFSLSISNTALAQVDTIAQTVVEVPVDRVFVPPAGYDDNDNVEIVLDGFLPNKCYTVAYQRHQWLGSNRLTVQQFAYKQLTAECQDTSLLSPADRLPRRFTETVNLLQVAAGNYEVILINRFSKPFTVAHATTENQDDRPYAPIENAFVQFSRENSSIQAVLTGETSSDCMNVEQDISSHQTDDVFVVLPTFNVSNELFCALVMRPFERQVQLQPEQPGRYLLHVRSQSGASINRVFSVEPQE